MPSADTHPEAHRVQLEVWRRMGPAGRSRAASAMSEALFQTVRAQIAALRPEWGPREVTLALIRRLHCVEVATRADGGRPVLATIGSALDEADIPWMVAGSVASSTWDAS